MQSLFLTTVFASLMFMGFSAAFAAALGFVWVDIVKPQLLAHAIITHQPLSLIAAVATISLFVLKDRKHAPKLTPILILLALFAIWITITTAMSSFPDRAWYKWDWALKVVIFAVIFPYIFRSRIQIEAFILVFIFSAATIFFSAGLKTLFGGGGYGVLAIMGVGNTGLAESSTLALVCVMLIPLILFSMRNTVLIPQNKLTFWFFIGIIFIALATVVGTAARTGVIAIAVLFAVSILKSPKRFYWIGAAAIVGIILMNIDISSTPWGSRMSTIETYEEDSSALGRIAVWKWTIEYVASHPLGGGFDAYMHNRIAWVAGDGLIGYYPDGEPGGKAFHSVYFEILGEQGIPGFIFYFLAITLALLKLRSLKKKWSGHPGMAWLANLADAMTTSILVYLAGGAFVGIAYQPFIFYLLSLTVAIDQYAARVERGQSKKTGNVKF